MFTTNGDLERSKQIKSIEYGHFLSKPTNIVLLNESGTIEQKITVIKCKHCGSVQVHIKIGLG